MSFLLAWLLLLAPQGPLQLTPEHVHPGDSYVISVPDLASARIDLRYRFRHGPPQDALNFCQLDEAGQAPIAVPGGTELGTIEVIGVRQSGTADWRPVEATITVEEGPTAFNPGTLRLLGMKVFSRGGFLLVVVLGLAWLLLELALRRLTLFQRAAWIRWECFWIVFAVALIACQILLPPAIGLADNGDFPKVAGRFSLAPADSSYDSKFFYADLRYAYRPAAHWVSDLPSSEILLAAASSVPARLLGSSGVFDLRYLGILHAGIFLAAFVLLLVYLRPFPKLCRLAIPPLILCLFADLAYSSYFNTFYPDAGAFAFLMLALVAGLFLARRTTLAWLAVFGLAAAFLVTSKSQHALLALPLAVYLVRSAFAATTRTARWVAAGLAATVLLLGAWMIQRTPWSYKAQASFNLIFHDELRYSKDPQADLQRLGLPPEDRQFIGMHAFLPEGPAANQSWLRDFASKTGHGKLLRLYLSEPRRLLDRARRFSLWLTVVRQRNLANFQKQDGFPPGTVSPAFSVWSRWKSAWLYEHPLRKICLGFLLLLCGALIAAVRSQMGWRKMAGVEACFLLLAMAAIEFLLACYGDAVENARHLFLFHALSDAALCLAAGGAMVMISRHFSRSKGHSDDHSNKVLSVGG